MRATRLIARTLAVLSYAARTTEKEKTKGTMKQLLFSHSTRVDDLTTLILVLGDGATSQHLETRVLQCGRGTRGTSTAVSSGDD